MSENTLKKAILLFDEIHVTDRPSFVFGRGNSGGQFGTIGAESPLRQFEESFRENGVPLYVHGPSDDYLKGDALAQVHADINDRTYLAAFQDGLRVSDTFSGIQIAKGKYGEDGTDDQDVRRLLSAVDLDGVLAGFDSPEALFYDPSVRHMDLSTPEGRAKFLIATAATSATKLNQAINRSGAEGFTPLSDARPYGLLLGRKYVRAADVVRKADAKVTIADLSFAVLDEIVPNEVIERLSLMDAVAHRKAAAGAREAFLEYLDSLRVKLPEIEAADDYEQQLLGIIEGEIRPAARKYRSELTTIDEKFRVKLVQGALGAGGGSGLVSLFTNLGWGTILPLAGAAGAFVASAAVEAWAAHRAKEREFSLSYVLSLDD